MDIQAEESYKELLKFLRYYRNFGTPIIIGGWAVYFYNPHFGSVDIDVVGPSMGGAFHDALDSYVHANGYSLVPMDAMGLQLVPVKEIRKKGTVIANVELDAATFEDPAASKFHEDNRKELPFALCWEEEHRRDVTLAKDCVCYIPSKSLLLLYKIKALRDRSFDLKTKGATMHPKRVEWLRGKVAKDRTDILALLDPEPKNPLISEGIDRERIKTICTKFKLGFCLETLEQLLDNKEALGKYHVYNPNLTNKKLRSIIDKLMI